MKSIKPAIINSNDKKQPNQYTVSADGKAWISQRECARILFINQSTVSRFVDRNASPELTNENKQLSELLFLELVKTHRLKGNQHAEILTDKLMEAGARAYIYLNAGIDVTRPSKLLEQKVERLTDESAKKDNVIRLQKLTIRQQADKSLNTAMRTKHQILMDLVEDGLLTAEHRQYRKWIYGVTAKGKLAGYTLNKNGTVIHPKED